MSQEHDNNNSEEEQELIKIEKLSQKLELLYKDMEQIRRENLLFESYLIRNEKDQPKVEEQEEKKGKKSKNKQGQEKLELTKAEKYEIAQFESDALKKNIDDGRVKSDAILETLRAILEETDMAITAIRKDAFEFQREILIGGENQRTGKIEAERIAKYFEEKLRAKDAEIEKLKSKKATYESQIFKTNNQIIKKEEMGDDLKFIDFHQLQIENKKYVKEIDEKNQKLLKLKISTGKISTKLIDLRSELQSALNEVGQKTHQNADLKTSITRVKQQQEKITKQKEDLDRDKRKLKFEKDKMENEQNRNDDQITLDTMGYVKLKSIQKKLLYDIKNYLRKIDIAELSHRKAKKILDGLQQY
ncbi:hypothetical protein PPERSA_08475 [Pseudocohnilembus persalinus]|uniref:Cilia- and flagella-associated protein 263 n=1 Tax=Pseudocohnilembus persalinus TaxID=266149 RepID=A0A0V0R7D1_PSEPJ|nr:hypothetical protein PPERSA_08475 [Pseudocohnilembus persalinus]|eukprot:KRX10072.1 hypothetical protein PPERSA_08475 [Pseudocohnilembus persalinus]